MHSYSVDSAERRIVPYYLAVVALAATFALRAVLQSFGFDAGSIYISPPALRSMAFFIGPSTGSCGSLVCSIGVELCGSRTSTVYGRVNCARLTAGFLNPTRSASMCIRHGRQFSLRLSPIRRSADRQWQTLLDLLRESLSCDGSIKRKRSRPAIQTISTIGALLG